MECFASYAANAVRSRNQCNSTGSFTTERTAVTQQILEKEENLQKVKEAAVKFRDALTEYGYPLDVDVRHYDVTSISEAEARYVYDIIIRSTRRVL